MTPTEETIKGFIDPFGRWEEGLTAEAFLKLPNGYPRKELLGDSLEMFLGLRLECVSKDVIERYAELHTSESGRMQIVPYTEDLWDKLINPIRIAKKSYALGDDLSAIALVGLAAEMLALLTFEVYGPFASVRKKASGRQLSFNEFEKYGQTERIEILGQKVQLTQIEKFRAILEVRREYLHFWSTDYKNIKADSKRCYVAVFELLASFLDPGVSDGKLTLHPLVLAAVKRWQEQS
mgnify:CR=1 FL=1